MEFVNIQAEIWWHEHFSEVLSSSAEEQNQEKLKNSDIPPTPHM